MGIIDEIDGLQVEGRDEEEVAADIIRFTRRAIIPFSLIELQGFDFLPRDWDVLEHVLQKMEVIASPELDEHLDSPTLIKLGNLLYCKNEFQDAADHYRRALDKDDLPVARKNLGIALLAGGMIEEGRKVFEEAVKKVDDDPILWFYLGLSHEYGREGRYKDKAVLEKVLEFYDRSLELDPDYGPAKYNKGCVLHVLGRKEEAKELITDWLKENPSSEVGWNDRGLLLRATGDVEGALKCYENAIKLNPKFDLAWINKAVALFSLAKYDESIEAINKALDLNPDSEIAMCNKGAALSEMGRYEEAIECFDRAEAINPDFKGVVKNRERALKAIVESKGKKNKKKGNEED